MDRPLAVLLAVAGVLASGCIYQRQPNTRIPLPPLNDAESVKRLWLTQTCDKNQEAALEAQMVRFRLELEPLLIRAFLDDVPPEDLRAVEQSATRQFTEARGSDAASGELQAHVTRERNNYISGYKSAALAGLGVVGGADAKRLLEQVAADAQSPYQHNAQLALKMLTAARKKTANP